MEIYIDGDGCPVVDLTIKIAQENKIPCTIITDTSHIFNKEPDAIFALSSVLIVPLFSFLF